MLEEDSAMTSASHVGSGYQRSAGAPLVHRQLWIRAGVDPTHHPDTMLI